ncbi:hypothetical protein EWM62_03775 [Mucilaginibacter terrigena]|uniref:Lipocalin-like domain-containing protein n=1 Tax=Mucilaginibacter terrigena TaxID=2492395 RepID=A0A4Q5LNX3_9SPHI|nr:hypothetical protein [Mucilaginibacter terrigena]RYU91066.1 hypothetical protein EWM62_03775 [Mucilaginibacter terrigena]
MKKVYFLFFIAISLGLSSCKKEAAEQPKTLEISGNWKLTSLSTEYIFGDKSVAILSNQPTSDYVDHIYFKADGSGTMIVKGITIRKFKYVTDDTKIHFTEVTDLSTNDYVGTGAFVSYITRFTGTELEMTDKVFAYGVDFYKNDRFDQLQRHLALVKEQ